MNSEREEKVTPYPGSPGPLSPGRTDLNPEHEPGIDELPSSDDHVPLDSGDESVVERDMTDVDPDHAERDDQPNPR
jgi:hypothetical protein